jgi:hypothetical protein
MNTAPHSRYGLNKPYRNFAIILEEGTKEQKKRGQDLIPVLPLLWKLALPYFSSPHILFYHILISQKSEHV